MKRSGFTLIELLGVLIVLGFIALITVPVINNSMKNTKQKLYDDQIFYIKEGLKDWGSSNIFMLPENNDAIILSLGQIKQSGNLERIIKNPKNNKCFSNDTLLQITKNNNTFLYEIKYLKETECDELEDAPTLKLNGSVTEYIKVGENFTDMGSIAKTSDNVDITDNIVTTITGSSNVIDTTQTGTYQITYSITDNNKTMIALRNIFITE